MTLCVERVLRHDGAHLLRSNQKGWTAELLRPIWYQSSGRTQTHVFVCIFADAIWKTLGHILNGNRYAQREQMANRTNKRFPKNPESGRDRT
ncbi:MAG: hypothetical protein EXS09_16510 [Gemmataceae bacterium]|nr:hypothetical protein [Gemmataceae bacterium]